VDGIHPHNLGEATENRHPLDISFLVHGGLFPPPIGTEATMALLVIFSLKSLEDHLLHSKDFA
jgi:uncharacterized protein (UPF0303 family)